MTMPPGRPPAPSQSEFCICGHPAVMHVRGCCQGGYRRSELTVHDQNCNCLRLTPREPSVMSQSETTEPPARAIESPSDWVTRMDFGLTFSEQERLEAAVEERDAQIRAAERAPLEARIAELEQHSLKQLQTWSHDEDELHAELDAAEARAQRAEEANNEAILVLDTHLAHCCDHVCEQCTFEIDKIKAYLATHRTSSESNDSSGGCGAGGGVMRRKWCPSFIRLRDRKKMCEKPLGHSGSHYAEDVHNGHCQSYWTWPNVAVAPPRGSFRRALGILDEDDE